MKATRRLACCAMMLAAAIQSPAFGASDPLLGGDDPEGTAHKFHVSYGRMAVEDTLALLHIRLFRDDLEETLQQRFADPAFTLAANPRADSLFLRYFNEMFVLKQDDVQVPGRIVSSGEETMGREAMWWYTVQFDAPAALRTFTVRNVVLLDGFDDQK
jgi:hypothetical protein